MTNVLLIGDIHLSDTPPVSCTESYTDDLFDLLAHTVTLAREHNAVTVWAGDIFHIKGPTRNSHALVQRTIDIIQSYPNGNIYVVPGNHDLSNDRLESIDSQPLGVLFKAGARYLKGWAGEAGPDFPIYGVPWLQRFTDVSVPSALAEYRRLAGHEDHALVVTHAPLYPPGKELPYENYPASKWADALGNTGSVF